VIQGLCKASLAEYLPRVLGLHSLSNNFLAALVYSAKEYDDALKLLHQLMSCISFVSSFKLVSFLVKGCLPVSITYIIIPAAHISTA